MGALTPIIAAAGLAASTPIPADGVARWHDLIEAASTKFGVPAHWIEQVMRAESRGQTMLNGRPIRSSAGAIGLMQLMPETWATMRAKLGTDPDDPHDNIFAGTFFLRLMYDRFGYPGLFGAYNAGPGRYARSIATGSPLPGETRAYLAKVSGTVARETVITPTMAPSVFAVRHDREVTVGDVSSQPRSSIFAVRSGTP